MVDFFQLILHIIWFERGHTFQNNYQNKQRKAKKKESNGLQV